MIISDLKFLVSDINPSMVIGGLTTIGFQGLAVANGENYEEVLVLGGATLNSDSFDLFVFTSASAS